MFGKFFRVVIFSAIFVCAPNLAVNFTKKVDSQNIAQVKKIASTQNNEQLFFMPFEQKQALNALLSSFKSAKQSIQVSIYSFTNKEIAKALKDAAARGVKVAIIYDKDSNAKNKTSTIGYLAKYKNISVCLLEGLDAGKYKGIMHQKMAIVDSRLLVLGSANWSKSAFEYNYETLLFSDNTEFVAKAQRTFALMAQKCQMF
ncbi:nuclease NucT [Helicobacter sp. MIT 00-7814]|uniref:phospholipase D-like domain-containing protein n=1 Tax=unclassified Helicobacter TaxID=2593540 RepID=UPI000E1FB09C|nr:MULTISPECIES: phospholipase D-like domain-containing protein [unclassified Helicobacter]RDU55855.1 nuclease NucT [Helicobacter sp. MIT 00-7814]RDU56813.1 nuclease NucT [Helicobacter sp. MIT 99-10781]